VEVSGGGLFVHGLYVELQQGSTNEAHDCPVYRRIRVDGSWADAFLFYDALLCRWCISDTPWQTQWPRAWSSSQDNSIIVHAWEISDWWQQSDAQAGSARAQLQVAAKTVRDLSTDARREAKAIFKEPKKFTKYRSTCSTCPSQCNNSAARDWGLHDESALYAHIILFHRSSQEYYEINRKYWDEALAQELRVRPEHDLYSQFERFMHKHGYEKKTTTQTVEKHAKFLRYICNKLEMPLTREMPENPDVFHQISTWPEEITSKGHYSVSLRWFKKFVEISVVEEVLAAHPDEAIEWNARPGSSETSKPDEERSAPPIKKAKMEKSTADSALEFDWQEVFKSSSVADAACSDLSHISIGASVKKVAQAPDPYTAILQLNDRVLEPRLGPSTQQSSRAHRSIQAVPEPAPEPAPLSQLFGRVADGDRSVAESIAAWEETAGPCKLALKQMCHESRQPMLHSICSEDREHLWLWAYCGVRDRTSVLKSLIMLRPEEGLLIKLLSVAKSPHVAPLDLLASMEAVFETIIVPERIDWKYLQVSAKKSFKTGNVCSFLSKQMPWSAKLAVFGAVLGERLSNWPGTAKEVTLWWDSFLERVKDAPLQEWYFRASFATGFYWSFDQRDAYQRLTELSATSGSCNSSQRSDFDNLQKHASLKLGSSNSNINRNSKIMNNSNSNDIINIDDDDAESAASAARALGSKESNENNSEVAEVASKGLQLTAEQRSRIEANRLAALARKRQASTLATSAPYPEAVVQKPKVEPRPVATPCASEVAQRTPELQSATGIDTSIQEPGKVEARPVVAAPCASEQPTNVDTSIKELDNHVAASCVKGRVEFRCDHKTGGGFHLRLQDPTGSIDVKFFEESANAFRAHEALCKGAVVRLRGFSIHPLSTRQLEYAPPGRSHELRCRDPRVFSVEKLQEPTIQTSAMQPLGLLEALSKPHLTRVNVRSAWVVEVDAMEWRKTTNGQTMAFRVVWLAQDSKGVERVRWTLWNSPAEQYGQKQLLKQSIAISGATVKVFRNNRELTGCWKEGGIQVV